MPENTARGGSSLLFPVCWRRPGRRVIVATASLLRRRALPDSTAATHQDAVKYPRHRRSPARPVRPSQNVLPCAQRCLPPGRRRRWRRRRWLHRRIAVAGCGAAPVVLLPSSQEELPWRSPPARAGFGAAGGPAAAAAAALLLQLLQQVLRGQHERRRAGAPAEVRLEDHRGSHCVNEDAPAGPAGAAAEGRRRQPARRPEQRRGLLGAAGSGGGPGAEVSEERTQRRRQRKQRARRRPAAPEGLVREPYPPAVAVGRVRQALGELRALAALRLFSPRRLEGHTQR